MTSANPFRLSFSVGGLILDKTVTNPNFAGMAVFTPVINGEESLNLYMYERVFLYGAQYSNIELVLFCSTLCVRVSGVGGNLVAVQASRISTYLHMNGLPMGDPNPTPRKCPTPCTSFFGSCKLTGGCGTFHCFFLWFFISSKQIFP